jgi:hypothetical protein
MATHEKKLIDMARNAKRSRIPLEVLTRGAKPWAAKILEDEYNRFKPRKFTDKLTAPPASLAESDEFDRAYPCEHGHPNCSIKDGGNCYDEAMTAREKAQAERDEILGEDVEVNDLRQENDDLQEKLGQALEMLRETEDELAVISFRCRDEIFRAMEEAEEKAIDSLARYKFQMFGYWAACWVHANNMAKRAGLGGSANPFAALVKEARKIRDEGES